MVRVQATGRRSEVRGQRSGVRWGRVWVRTSLCWSRRRSFLPEASSNIPPDPTPDTERWPLSASHTHTHTHTQIDRITRIWTFLWSLDRVTENYDVNTERKTEVRREGGDAERRTVCDDVPRWWRRLKWFLSWVWSGSSGSSSGWDRRAAEVEGQHSAFTGHNVSVKKTGATEKSETGDVIYLRVNPFLCDPRGPRSKVTVRHHTGSVWARVTRLTAATGRREEEKETEAASPDHNRDRRHKNKIKLFFRGFAAAASWCHHLFNTSGT